MTRMRIAYVGTGYVADFYQKTLANHADALEVVGVYDRDEERTAHFSRFHGVRGYDSLESVLDDDAVDMVVNLTNPEAHYDVSKQSLAAGKHVYSEKPLAMDYEQAKELVADAERAGLRIASAPSSLLGETAQTVWKALRTDAIGEVYLAYASLDGGLKHRQPYRNWASISGMPWPAKNEFETGCTVEHAGYTLTWMCAFFGPAKTVTSFSKVLVEDKQTDESLDVATPDFSDGCIEFESGVVVRITNSIVARLDHSLRIFGEEGTLLVLDTWDYGAPVYVETRTPMPTTRWARLARKAERGVRLIREPRQAFGERIPLVREDEFEYPPRAPRMDFMRGVREVADAIREDRPSRMSAESALHITEITLTLQQPEVMGVPRKIESTFDPVEPMPWGR